MPITKSAQKEVRVAGRRNIQNKSIRTKSKTQIDKAEKLISSGELDQAKNEVKAAISTLDKAAKKGTIHPNNAARRKSRLMKKLNQAVSSAKPKTTRTRKKKAS